MLLDPGIGNLRVLASGPTPRNPAELLAGPYCRQLIDGLRALADFVIVDTPPVLAVADASILARLADGAIFVVDGENTKRSTIAQSRSQLNTAGGRILGVVYNNFDPNQSRAYPYEYYGHYYSQTSYGAVTEQGGNGHKNGKVRVIRERLSSMSGAARPDGPEDKPAVS
jgi:receptor protein-tyrosine kinase